MLVSVECHLDHSENRNPLVLNCVETTVGERINSAPCDVARLPETLAIQNTFDHRGQKGEILQLMVENLHTSHLM